MLGMAGRFGCCSSLLPMIAAVTWHLDSASGNLAIRWLHDHYHYFFPQSGMHLQLQKLQVANRTQRQAAKGSRMADNSCVGIP